MKKLIITILFLITILSQSVFAEEIFKISSVNYDTSNSLIFLTSPDNTSIPIVKELKLTRLSSPNRAYFDINSAVLTCEKQNFQFSNGTVKQVIVSQNSINPNVVRVVLYFEEGFNPEKIKLLRINNNIIIKTNDKICSNCNYFQNTYRDEKSSNQDFYEALTISSQTISSSEKKIQNESNDKVLSQIQQAFENSTIPVNVKTVYQNAQVNSLKKDLKLNTEYYVNGITQKQNGILISGFGSITTEKPITLTSPSRIVYDLPNTIINPEIRNKEFKINETETIKLGQFEINKARVVITTPKPDKYLPIYSPDNQTMLIANKETLNHSDLLNITTNVVSYNYKKINDSTSEFTLNLSRPVVHSIKRNNSSLVIYLFNAAQFNEQDFKSTIKGTDLADMKLELMPTVGLRLTLPTEINDVIYTYSGTNAKSIKFTIKFAKKQLIPSIPIFPSISKIEKKNSNEKSIIIDAGHGGVDYGATRAGINEKDITLDVSQRIAAILKSKGYRVNLTRNTDKTLSLQERVDITEQESPDFFVSVHVNSSVKDEIYGIETHYYHDYSVGLAQTIHSKLAETIQSKDRGLFKSKFYVINHTTMPAILVEIGFISNETERASLVTEKRKQQTAQAIAEGIINYYKQLKK